MTYEQARLRFQENWKSGATVSLVSLPLSISLSIASGATPLMGVITAVWAGLFAAVFGGSNYNIVGPTGALSGLLAAFALTHGAQALPLLALLSGLITFVAFLLRWERYIVFIPASVVHGFTLGVAFIIGLNQLNFAFGLSNLPVHSEFIANVGESLRNLGNANLVATTLFASGLCALLFIAKKFPKTPGAIFLAGAGIGLGYLSETGTVPIQLQTLFSRYGEIPASIFSFPDLSLSAIDRATVLAATTVAIVAILETLISAKIAGGMTRTKFNQRKELFGLAVANVASGLTGGIPATAALARTALNVRAGATHSSSAIINAISVAIIALVLLPAFKYLPLAIVASILVFVAIRMVEREHFKHLFRHDRYAFGLSIFVAGVTVIEDPILGIVAGSAVALLGVVKKLSQVQGEITINRNREFLGRHLAQSLKELEDHGDILVYRLAGELTYINCQGLCETADLIKEDTKKVVLGFRNLFYVDIDGLDNIAEIIESLEQRGKIVALSGINPAIAPFIEKTEWYKRLAKQKLLFSSSRQAVTALEAL